MTPGDVRRVTVTPDQARRAAAAVRAAVTAGCFGGGDLAWEAMTLVAFVEQGDDTGGTGVPKKTHKPEAVIKMALNGKTFAGERWCGEWVIHCPAYPDLAETYKHVADASPAIEEFVRRAGAESQEVAR